MIVAADLLSGLDLLMSATLHIVIDDLPGTFGLTSAYDAVTGIETSYFYGVDDAVYEYKSVVGVETCKLNGHVIECAE